MLRQCELTFAKSKHVSRGVNYCAIKRDANALIYDIY